MSNAPEFKTGVQGFRERLVGLFRSVAPHVSTNRVASGVVDTGKSLIFHQPD